MKRGRQLARELNALGHTTRFGYGYKKPRPEAEFDEIMSCLNDENRVIASTKYFRFLVNGMYFPLNAKAEDIFPNLIVQDVMES